MNRRHFLLLGAFAPFAGAAELLPRWTPGTLDIHHISTGKGNCAFVRCPDGSTLVIDAGATARTGRVSRQYPNSDRSVAAWIADYIHAFAGDDVRIDNVFLTHFHGDHIGDPGPASPRSKDGNWVLAGITELATLIPVHRILDRGWPDYNYPSPLRGRTIDNYRAFLKWHVQNGGQVERARPGSKAQMQLRYPDRYPEYAARTIAANGEVWTGKGDQTRQCFPPLSSLPRSEYPEENVCCASLLISYGAFRYFHSGDTNGFLQYGTPRWHDMETPIAEAIGKIDVFHVSHHGFVDGANERFLALTQPKTHIISAWSPTHPSHSALLRMLNQKLYPGKRSVYSTNTMEEARFVVGGPMEQVRSHQGHIVIRVPPPGREYHVYILNNTNTERAIALHDGPVQAG